MSETTTDDVTSRTFFTNDGVNPFTASRTDHEDDGEAQEMQAEERRVWRQVREVS